MYELWVADVCDNVAPVRERGLKCRIRTECDFMIGRSRKGAWIEIAKAANRQAQVAVAPVRERGLKCIPLDHGFCLDFVAPVRERGLKLRALRLP